MKKLLPCSFTRAWSLLLLFVALFATNAVSAQQSCGQSRATNPDFPNQVSTHACAGDLVLWTTTTFNGVQGEPLNWSFVGDGSNGAYFTNANGDNLGLTETTNLSGINPDLLSFNSILVRLGPAAGTVEVRMVYGNNPAAQGCSSGATSVRTVITATPSIQRCAQDTGTITAVGGTIYLEGTAPSQLPAGNLVYTLYTPGTPPIPVPSVPTNTTGIFSGLNPGNYVVGVTNFVGCDAFTGTIPLVNPPIVPVDITCPPPFSRSACLFADQDAVNTAFNTWLASVTSSGGTGTRTVTITSLPNPPVAPLLSACTGSVTVSWKVVDECLQEDTCSSTFAISAPDVVVPFIPLDVHYKACDIIDGTDLQGRINAYKDLFDIVSGGCDPKFVFDPSPLPANLCDGIVVISGHIEDSCIDDIPFSRILFIDPPLPVISRAPLDDVRVACAYKTQQELIDAYTEWVKGFSIDPIGGCNPTITVEPQTLPDFCGGVITVVATVKDKCLIDRILTAKFGVDPATDIVINNCPVGRDLGCNPQTIPGPTVLDVTSSCPVKTLVADVTTNVDCLYKLTRTYTVTDDCLHKKECVEVYTYKIDTEKPVISGIPDKEVPGSGEEDPNLCTPTTTLGGIAKNITGDGGTSNATIDFSQPRTGDAPDELLKWTNGTTTAQSEYVEGMGVPQRLLLAGLKGTKHTMRFRHEAVKKQGKSAHGYDFLMSWEQAVKTGENIGNNGRSELKNLLTQECDGGWSGAGQAQCLAMTTSGKADIPDDMGNPPNQVGNRNVDDNIDCFEAIYGNRQIEVEGTTAVSNVVLKFDGYTGRTDGDNYAWYTLSWESSSPAVLIKWAGRLAPGGGSCGYGNCHGAGSIKGNPYHMRLEGIDGKGAGSRDNQVKCKRPTVCVVDIPVNFDTPKVTDCPDKAVLPVKVGPVVSTVNEDGSITRCQKWSATDECGNTAEATQCITIVCPPGSPNLEEVNTSTSKTTGTLYTPTNTVNPIGETAISRFAAYPNPFTNSYSLSLDTSSTERVNLNVYDMLGKQLDQRVTTPGEINELNLGGTYPTGNYILRLEQATEVRTLRLLKQ